MIEELCRPSTTASNLATASRAELDRLLAGCRNDVDRLAVLRNQRPGSTNSDMGAVSPAGSRGSSRSSRGGWDTSSNRRSATREYSESGYISPKSRLRSAPEHDAIYHPAPSRAEGLSSEYESRMRKYYSDMANLESEDEESESNLLFSPNRKSYVCDSHTHIIYTYHNEYSKNCQNLLNKYNAFSWLCSRVLGMGLDEKQINEELKRFTAVRVTPIP